jgi:hypothetical protein
MHAKICGKPQRFGAVVLVLYEDLCRLVSQSSGIVFVNRPRPPPSILFLIIHDHHPITRMVSSGCGTQ